MAFRGRGRGRGGGRGGFPVYFKQEPFELFPDVELPEVKSVLEDEKALVIAKSRLQNYLKSSPYYLEETASVKTQSIDIERFSDWMKPKGTLRRESLDQYLQLQSCNFPKELLGVSRRGQRAPKRARWVNSGILDRFEELEKKLDGQDIKKEDEGEEDAEDVEAEEAEEESSDDDYLKGKDYDDDEDDYNLDEGNDDEPIY